MSLAGIHMCVLGAMRNQIPGITLTNSCGTNNAIELEKHMRTMQKLHCFFCLLLKTAYNRMHAGFSEMQCETVLHNPMGISLERCLIVVMDWSPQDGQHTFFHMQFKKIKYPQQVNFAGGQSTASNRLNHQGLYLQPRGQTPSFELKCKFK